MEENDLSLREKIENLVEHTRDLGETGYQLAILELTDKTSKMVSNLVVIFAILFLANALMVFLGFTLAYWLTNVFHSQVIAFSIVSGLYLLLIVFLFSIRKKVIIPFFMNLIVKKIYE
jgi:hypothetical protein